VLLPTVAAFLLTVASYGSLARFKSLSRMHQVSPNCILGVGGDYSDFQQLQTMVDAEMTAQYVANDGLTLSPKYVRAATSRTDIVFGAEVMTIGVGRLGVARGPLRASRVMNRAMCPGQQRQPLALRSS